MGALTERRMDSDISFNMSIVNEKKKYSSIWNLIFSKNNDTPWISFKPKLGIYVYPCYACRDMFGSKTTFQDHTNRRAIMIKYKCVECKEDLTFYNRCSFLLHARSHFSLVEGKIDLNHLEIFSLPFGMMGFLPYPGINVLFDCEEDAINENYYINTQFYSPDASENGKDIVTLKPNDLLFCSSEDDPNIIQLTLKQISRNIPLCQFVTLDCQKKLRQNYLFIDNSVRVKEEVLDSNDNSERSPSPVSNDNESQTPVISTIDSLTSNCLTSTFPLCPECKTAQKQPMMSHFVGKNIPFDENLKCPVCKYVASTKCSYSAHQRIHANVAPFICPECGMKFESRNVLLKHLDDTCFHLAKQIRIRCTGKRCGKLLASAATFTAHFAQHVNPWFKCDLCNCCFGSLMEFSQHAQMHSTQCTPDRVFKCSGCKTEDSIILQENIPQHIEYHSKDRSRYMYVFICKFCKNYFRSTVTYAAHLLKCQRMQESKKQEFSFSVDYCRQCQNRIIFYENEKSASCSKCHCLTLAPSERKELSKSSDTNENGNAVSRSCILCQVDILDNNFEAHQTRCVYRNPVIVLDKLTDEIIEKHVNGEYDWNEMADSFAESKASESVINSSSNENSPQKSDSLDSNDSSKPRLTTSPRSADNAKRKRKRAPFVFRGKRPAIPNFTEEVIDLQADEPMPFDGTYYCKLCDFQEISRDKFHEHITCHRDISTAYQCMECGECFVVKPSLIKHLMHYHKIEDTNAYFDSNNCYDRGAVEELKEIMKLAPGETREPVRENQCRVCLEEFSDSQELTKHFRIHGMAFLMKNTRD